MKFYIATITVLVIIVGVLGFLLVYSHLRTQPNYATMFPGLDNDSSTSTDQNDTDDTTAPASDQMALQTQCANDARTFFNANFNKSNGDYYQNHFNAKLQKCFIQVTNGPKYSPTNLEGFIYIDVYDAVEGKHYASFSGWEKCDTNDNFCSGSGGDIWFDGNDQRHPSDIVLTPSSNNPQLLGQFTADVNRYFMSN